jgi:hypothetical protein
MKLGAVQPHPRRLHENGLPRAPDGRAYARRCQGLYAANRSERSSLHLAGISAGLGQSCHEGRVFGYRQAWVLGGIAS